MSVSGNLPPQAYTREVLMKAFEWSQTQPQSVMERAGSADALVALYLQAKRRGTAADGTPLQWEQPTPASVEAFKADLKNLAEGLRQFDDDSFAPPHTTNPPAQAGHESGPAVSFKSPPVNPPPAATFSGPQASPYLASPAPTPKTAEGVSSRLDPKSRQWILEVQSRLNLSTEDDALRTLIAIGYERIRDLLPRS